jgi:hypothetical protein
MHNHEYPSMATQRREESERRAKRQGSCIRREGGDAFKASSTRGRIKEEVFLRKNVRNESQADISKDSQRPKQSD